MIIRRFQEEDTPAVMRLFFETVHAVNCADYSAEQLDAWAPQPLEEMDQRRWSTTLRNNFTFVAELKGDVIGFGELEPNGHIDRFYCHKNFQRQGVGILILRAIEDKAELLQLERLIAEVSITARPFFASKGFREICEQEVEVRGVTMRNYVMEKLLDG